MLFLYVIIYIYMFLIIILDRPHTASKFEKRDGSGGTQSIPTYIHDIVIE